ncbi:MAG: 16S rRNA (cytidine(1402)-2'-O)-methyltransferase [Acidobacteriota bacterium]
MPGTLYVVATPLGNLEDLTERASRILREVNLVACEDTRHTRKLLNHVGSNVPAISYHEHNETRRAPEILRRLLAGEQIALVSDAGTPLVSDPGYRLVALCRQEGLAVVPVPGPSAVTAALSVSGLPTDRFLFLGFPPKRAAALREFLSEAASVAATLVFYVGPHDLVSFLRTVIGQLGNRDAFLIREMTKVFETAYSGPASEVLRQVESEQPKGEYTLVIEPGEAPPPSGTEPVDVVAYVTGLMQTRGLSQRDAIRTAAEDLGLPRRGVYSLFNRRESP